MKKHVKWVFMKTSNAERIIAFVRATLCADNVKLFESTIEDSTDGSIVCEVYILEFDTSEFGYEFLKRLLDLNEVRGGYLM